MIFNYPYFGMPNYLNHISHNSYNNPYQSYTNKSNQQQINNIYNKEQSQKAINTNIKNNNKYKKTYWEDSFDKENFPIFSLMGIDLYFDDILLICLIIFLYNEKINDNNLLLSLILLLLS